MRDGDWQRPAGRPCLIESWMSQMCTHEMIVCAGSSLFLASPSQTQPEIHTRTFIYSFSAGGTTSSRNSQGYGPNPGSRPSQLKRGWIGTVHKISETTHSPPAFLVVEDHFDAQVLLKPFSSSADSSSASSPSVPSGFWNVALSAGGSWSAVEKASMRSASSSACASFSLAANARARVRQ